MAAGMGIAFFAGLGMCRAGYGVQLADESHVGPAAFSDGGLNAGDRQSRFWIKSQLFQEILYNFCSAVLMIALLGMEVNILCQCVQLIGVGVNEGNNLFFNMIHENQLLISKILLYSE